MRARAAGGPAKRRAAAELEEHLGYKQSDHFPCAPLDLLVRDLLAPPERSIHWDTSKVTTFHV